MHTRKLSDNTTKYLDTYKSILDEMETKMQHNDNDNDNEVIDSISADFIKRMIPHHEAAVKMCENLLRYTTDLYLQEMAKNIIVIQSQGIEQMKSILTTCATIKNDDESIRNYNAKYKLITTEMLYNMEHAREVNNINCDFVAEMLPHHIGAIGMVKNTLQYDICPELKSILNDIISTQSKGVSELRVYQYKMCR